MRVTPYGRHSSPGQNAGSSHRRQDRKLTDYILRKGWDPLPMRYDPAVTADDGGNLQVGVLGEYYQEAQQGEHRGEGLAIEDEDRFSRAGADVATHFLTGLLVNGVTIAFVNTDRVISPGADAIAMLPSILGFDAAKRDNMKRKERIQANIDGRRDDPSDLFSSRVPDWLEALKKQNKKQRGRTATVRGERDKRLREIFDLGITYGGAGQITKLFNQRHLDGDPDYTPWRGDSWSQDQIANILSNRAVMGFRQMYRIEKRTDRPKGKDGRHPIRRVLIGERLEYPEIIDSDTFERAQSAKAARFVAKSGRPSRNNVNMFAGVCRCGQCGKAMHLMSRTGLRKQDWLVCAGVRRGTCASTHYGLNRLENAFITVGIRLLHETADFAGANADVEAAAKALDAAGRRLAKATDEVDRMQDKARAANESDMVEFYEGAARKAMRDMKEARVARDRLATDLARARARSDIDAFSEAEMLAAAVRAGCVMARARMSQLARTMIAEMTFDNRTVTITPARPIHLHTDGGMVERPQRRLVIDLLPSRGRPTADGSPRFAEILRIEGRPMSYPIPPMAAGEPDVAHGVG